MTATADQIAQLRRMVAEPTTTTYSDVVLGGYIEKYPLMDEKGCEPYYLDYQSVPPTRTPELDWIPTYDLNMAAAEIWAEKTAALAMTTDFNADGGSYSDSQKYQQAANQVHYYLSRRSASSIRLFKWPPERIHAHEHDNV